MGFFVLPHTFLKKNDCRYISSKFIMSKKTQTPRLSYTPVYLFGLLFVELIQ